MLAAAALGALGAQLAEIRAAKEDAAAVLSEPHDLAKAAQANPYRLGTMAGYACGRFKAVAEQASHPKAFERVALMPPPPPQKDCTLPDQRLLGMVVTEGSMAWPDDA